MRDEEFRFASGDYALVGRLFLPGGKPSACAVLNGATGVPQRYYRHFAKWLADEHGVACLTYDYRDFGLSAHLSVRRSKVTMADWGFVDQPAARAALRARFQDLPLWVIGHSLGALTLPLQDNLDDITRVIAVASGLVHLDQHPWPYRAMARSFWFGHGAAMTAFAGYLPRQAGLGADLPASVFRQWRLWCTSRNFYYDDPSLRLPQPNWPKDVPVDMFGFSDDEICTDPAVEKLAQFYQPCSTICRVAPKRGRKIGHLSVFTRQNSDYWPILLNGLNDQSRLKAG